MKQKQHRSNKSTKDFTNGPHHKIFKNNKQKNSDSLTSDHTCFPRMQSWEHLFDGWLDVCSTSKDPHPFRGLPLRSLSLRYVPGKEPDLPTSMKAHRGRVKEGIYQRGERAATRCDNGQCYGCQPCLRCPQHNIPCVVSQDGAPCLRFLLRW